MRKFCQSLAVLCLLLAPAVFAQTTTVVSGTVTDPNGLPYAFGTIQPTLSASGTPLIAGQPYIPPSTPTSLDSTGSFSVLLARNGSISPGGSTWSFTVCSAKGSVSPAFGKGSVCFAVTGITVAGATQSITTQLTAAALALTNAASVTAAPCGVDQEIQFNNAGACGFDPQFLWNVANHAGYFGDPQTGFDPNIAGYFNADTPLQIWGLNRTGGVGLGVGVQNTDTDVVAGYLVALLIDNAGGHKVSGEEWDVYAAPAMGMTTTNIQGVSSYTQNLGPGTVTDQIGFNANVDAPAGGGVVTHAYGYKALAIHAAPTGSNFAFGCDSGTNNGDWCFFSVSSGGTGGKSMFHDLRTNKLSTANSTNGTQLSCASSASPAVCADTAAGGSAIAAAATTLVVNTTAVTAISQILVTRDDSLGTLLGVTCNTQSSLVLGTPRVTARTAGTSFTIALDVGPTTDPMCISWLIVN